MKSKAARPGSVIQSFHAIVAIACVTLLSSGSASTLAQTPPATEPAVQESATPEPETPKIPNEQLDSLVAPIALYSDPLLAQTLVASTYPLEVIQLQQWMEKNKKLKDKALADAVAKQKWDPSIQALAAFPEVTQRLAGNIQWTADLGNAFLAQQADVMDAVQRMRTKAEGKGALKTNSQQKVTTRKVEGNKEVIVIEQANPEVVYIPSYDPEVVYGPATYPYYPYYYPGYYPGMGLAWGTGLILGAAWINNNWGDCNWGNGDININRNNNFNRNDFNRNNISNRPGGGNQSNRWQHRPEHRGNAPYADRGSQKKYGDNRRSQANRPSQQPNRGPGGDRKPSDRQATNRKSPQQRDASNRNASNRNTSNRSNANRPQNRSSNSIGNRQVSRNPSPRSNNAFSAPSRQMNRSSSFASQSRGSRSFSGGGRSMGGGSRGGGRRR